VLVDCVAFGGDYEDKPRLISQAVEGLAAVGLG
jgi:hypothetical protein